MKTKLAFVLVMLMAAVTAGCGGGGAALSIESVSPTADATDVGVTTAITVTFNRNIDESTITDATFTLTGAGGLAVAGTVTYDAGTMAATFTPTNPLTNWMTYTATITTGVSTSSSAPISSSVPATKGALSADFTWEFTAISRKFLYTSPRALDGSDAALANGDTGNVWSIAADGSNDTPLTSLSANNTQSNSAQWSPDGTQIAFDSLRALDGSDAANTGNTSNIWVIDADGSNATPLTNLTVGGDSTVDPQWSPDGSQIVYSSARALDGSNAENTNGTDNIWVMDADGSNATPLTSITALWARSDTPQWSPDGTKIAFRSERALDGSNAINAPGGTHNIWVMNADGSGVTPLTRITAADAGSWFPRWSPDGLQIVYESGRALDGSDNIGTATNIWMVDADGSNDTPLTRLTAASSFNPAWSLDGASIVFSSTRALDGSDAANTNGTWNIWSMNADGSSPTPLTSLTATDANSFSPLWRQDGTRIAFRSDRALDGSDAANTNSTDNIWSMDADGTDPTPLTSLTADGARCWDLAL